MNALRSAQNSDSFRLQQLYQSIRNLEASLANKRQALGAQRSIRFVSRLMGHRKSKITRLTSKVTATVERRSLRELQSSYSNTDRFTNAIPKSTDSRLMPSAALIMNSSRIAHRFSMTAARCEAFVASSL
jgi:hypothetical protein